MNRLRIVMALALICFASAAVAAEQTEDKQGRIQTETQAGPKGKEKKGFEGKPGEGNRGAGRGLWWHRADMVEKIKLTETQVEKLDAIFEAARKEQSELRARAAQLRRELNDHLARAEMDEKQFIKTLEEHNMARARSYGVLIHMKYKTRKVLTPEQLETVLKEYPRVFRVGSAGGRSQQKRKRGHQEGTKKRQAQEGSAGPPPAPPSEQQK